MAKTQTERDLIDCKIAINAAHTRNQKLTLLDSFLEEHGEIPVKLLDAYGHSEWHRGFTKGVKDATDE